MPKQPRSKSLQVFLYLRPFTMTSHGEGIWTLEQQWFFYFKRYQPADTMSKVYVWISQFGPLLVRKWA